jgi:hypothetical protein
MNTTNAIPRNTLVLNRANKSKPLDNFTEKICVRIKTAETKIRKTSREKILDTLVITKNQKENPNVTAKDLNLGEDNSILNRIN